jgi:SDR family mycofactocin-dependent oxidoreductase
MPTCSIDPSCRLDIEETERIMALQFEGKVAFITGAARGQGRSHAVRFAEEGADIIAVDLCAQIDSVAYPMPGQDDLDETVNLVEKTGRRIVARRGDVRDFSAIKAVVADGVARFGRIDFVLANAGIAPLLGEPAHDISAFVDAVNVMLNGVYYTIEAAVPEMLEHGEGGAIVITSSTAGLNSLCPRFATRSHGLAGYQAAKHGVVGLMRYYATALAEKNIRVNTVHPTGVATPMIINDQFERHFAEHPDAVSAVQNVLPVDLVEPADISEAMVYLCGRSGRYVTGTTLPVDAGYTVK